MSVGRDISRGRISETSMVGAMDVSGAFGAGGHGHKFSSWFKHKNKRSSKDLLLAKFIAKLHTSLNNLAKKNEKLDFADLTQELGLLLKKLKAFMAEVRSVIEPLKAVLYQLENSSGWRSVDGTSVALRIANVDKVWLADWHAKSLEIGDILSSTREIITERLNEVLLRVLSAYRKIITVTNIQKSALESIFRDIDQFKRDYDADYRYFIAVLQRLDELINKSDLYAKISDVTRRLGVDNIPLKSASKKDKVKVFKGSYQSLSDYVKTNFSHSQAAAALKQCLLLRKRGLVLLGQGESLTSKELNDFVEAFSKSMDELRGSVIDFEMEALEYLDDRDPRFDEVMKKYVKPSTDVLRSMNEIKVELKSRITRKDAK